jgi:hypothetical protein
MMLNLKLITVALLVAIVGALAALTFAPEASAHTLSMRQARRQIKSLVVEKARYGYEPRSMVLYCVRRTAHFVRCDLSYGDLWGDQWCGTATAYLHGRIVTSRMRAGSCE